MSSLGAKVKELVRGGPHSQEAERGEVDRRTPGSFPTDDIATPPATKDTTTSKFDDATMTSISDDRNRLHKRGDPRGENPVHQHKDSAVGLNPSNDSYNPSQHPAQAEATQHPREGGLSQRQQPVLATSGGTGATAPTAEPDVTNTPTKREQAAAMSQPAGATGVQTTDSHHETAKHGGSADDSQNTPYWGDMPRGAGVYNGVTGHGSPEDQHQHRTGHEDATGTSQGHAESRNPVTEVTGTTQQRAFPLQGTSESHTQQPHGTDARDTRDSRFTEGLAGTGAATGAGEAACGLSHRSREDHPGQQTSEQSWSEQVAPTQTQEQKGGKLAGLFHSGSKEDKVAKEQRHQAEKREKEMKKEQERVQHQHEKDEKKRLEEIEKTKAKGSKEQGGFFSHHDAQQQHPVDNRATAAQSRDPRYDQAGLATAAATTAYAAHEGQQRHQGTQPTEVTHDEKSKESHGLGGIFGLAKKSNEHDQNVARRTAQPTSSQAAAGSSANYGSHSQPRDETHVPIWTRSGEQAPGTTSGHGDSHSGYGKAVGAGALGAGAGYGASRLAGDHRDHHDTTSTTHQQQPATGSGLSTQPHYAPTSQQPTTSHGLESTTHPNQSSGLGQTAAAAGVGAGAGYGASRLAGQHGHQDTSAASVDNRMQQTYGGSGHYDTPQSGTAAQTSAAGQSYPGGPDNHFGHSSAKVALAGAAAGGAGTAAYQHATRDASHTQAGSQGLHQGSSATHPSAAGTTGTSSSAGGFTAPQTHARTSHGHTTGTGNTGHSEPEAQKVEYNYLPDGTPSGVKISNSPRTGATSTGDNSLGSATHKGISQAPHEGHHSGTAAALGAAGAGGAGYLAHDHQGKANAKQREQAAVSNMPQGASGQTQPAVGDRGLTYSDDRHRTTTAGTAGHHHDAHYEKDDLQTRRHREQAAVSQLPQGAGGQSQPAVRDTDAPHYSQRDNRDLLAATVGVGAGAGAGVSADNAHDRHQREKDQASSYNTQPAHGSSTQPGHAAATSSSHPSQGGAYNTLPSGTKSGVAQGANQVPTHGASDLSSSQNRSAVGHGNQGHGGAQPSQYDSQSSGHKTAGAAGAGVAAGGLGAAVMGSRDNDSDRLRQEHSQYSQQSGTFDQGKSRLTDPTRHSTGDKSDRGQHFGGVASAIRDVAEGRSVTHDCSSCGHSEDISRYFKS